MIQAIGQLMVRGAGLLHKAVDATPVVGGIKGWTQQAAINNKTARQIVLATILTVLILMSVTLWQTFVLIQLGKVDAVVGSLIGGIFTFFGGVLAVIIPAYMNALKFLAPSQPVGSNQPVSTTSNSVDNKDLAAKP